MTSTITRPCNLSQACFGNVLESIDAGLNLLFDSAADLNIDRGLGAGVRLEIDAAAYVTADVQTIYLDRHSGLRKKYVWNSSASKFYAYDGSDKTSWLTTNGSMVTLQDLHGNKTEFVSLGISSNGMTVFGLSSIKEANGATAASISRDSTNKAVITQVQQRGANPWVLTKNTTSNRIDRVTSPNPAAFWSLTYSTVDYAPGRLTKVTSPDSTFKTLTYGSAPLELTESVSRAAQTTSYRYFKDSSNSLIIKSVQRHTGVAETYDYALSGTDLTVTANATTDHGNPRKVVFRRYGTSNYVWLPISSQDPSGYATTYTRTTDGAKFYRITAARGFGTSLDFSYLGNTELISQIKDNYGGLTKSMTFDSLGRILTRNTIKTADSTPVESVAIAWNSAHDFAEATINGMKYAHVFTTAGNLQNHSVSVTVPYNQQLYSYVFDSSLNRVTKFTSMTGDVMEYAYNSNGQVISKSVNGVANIASYTYNSMGDVSTINAPLGSVSMTSDPLANYSKMTFADTRGDTTISEYAYKIQRGQSVHQVFENSMSGSSGSQLDKRDEVYSLVGQLYSRERTKN
ncbi:hypothetical protein E3A20_06940 [Planctomyces bekefii]|uniref:Type IV secretion protein Rhs n=1 Tax=Planctomyces bekefii TaxID=1653850 RepID=A0A5C6M6S9_9PLAN|nr:hypothetical protein E3A20_06940 [Planctomyces bekefii]